MGKVEYWNILCYIIRYYLEISCIQIYVIFIIYLTRYPSFLFNKITRYLPLIVDEKFESRSNTSNGN